MFEQAIHSGDPTEQLIAEQAVLAFREAKRATMGAAHGHGLEVTERAVLTLGRQQMRQVMEALLLAQADAQKGGEAPRPAQCGKNASFKGDAPGQLISTVGEVGVRRAY